MLLSYLVIPSSFLLLFLWLVNFRSEFWTHILPLQVPLSGNNIVLQKEKWWSFPTWRQFHQCSVCLFQLKKSFKYLVNPLSGPISYSLEIVLFRILLHIVRSPFSLTWCVPHARSARVSKSGEKTGSANFLYGPRTRLMWGTYFRDFGLAKLITDLLKLPLWRAHNLVNRVMMVSLSWFSFFFVNCLVTERGFLCQVDRGWWGILQQFVGGPSRIYQKTDC